MTYDNRTDFVKEYGIHKTNVLETMKSFEKNGLNDKQIKMKLIENDYVTDRMFYEYINLFNKIRSSILWV